MFKNYLDKIKNFISRKNKKRNKNKQEKDRKKRKYSEIDHGVYVLKEKREKINNNLDYNFNKKEVNRNNEVNYNYIKNNKSYDNVFEKDNNDNKERKKDKKKKKRPVDGEKFYYL